MILLDFIPTWGIFLITVILIFLSFEAGFYFGIYRKNHAKNESQPPASSIIGATLGLLAFVLTFTFGLAGSRFQERMLLVIDDANAIETTYRRSGFLEESQQTQMRDLIYKYVSIRLPNSQPEDLQQTLTTSDELLNLLWDQATVIAKKNPNSVMTALFIQSLNQMIDLHSKRVAMATKIRVPLIIWGALYCVTILSMIAVGYYSALYRMRSILLNFVMFLAFSGIIFLIAELDSPHRGFIKVSQVPMTDLLKRISSSSI